MDLITQISEINSKQMEKFEELEKKFKELYEERILINDITEYVQTGGKLDEEIDRCNKIINQVNSYGFSNMKEEKKSAIDKLRKLKEYKKYVDAHNSDGIELKKLLNELKIENIKKTNECHMQQNEILSVIRNNIEVCKEQADELKQENGQSVDISIKFSKLVSIQKDIKQFDKYNGILSSKNKMELEKLETSKKMLLEEIGRKLPNLGEKLRNSIEEELHSDKKADFTKDVESNKNKIIQLGILEKELQEFEKKVCENHFFELTRKISEQEKNIVRIKMNIPEGENLKRPDSFPSTTLTPEQTQKIEKILNEPIKEVPTKEIPKEEIKTKKIDQFNIYESNNYERMNVKDFAASKEQQFESQELSPETIAKMDQIINEINNDSNKVDDTELNNYLFNGDDPIVPELPKEENNKFEEVVNRVKQNKLDHQNELRIERKSELENMKKYIYERRHFPEAIEKQEIAKKVKRKVPKLTFKEKARRLLNKIENWIFESDDLEEYNNELNGRTK